MMEDKILYQFISYINKVIENKAKDCVKKLNNYNRKALELKDTYKLEIEEFEYNLLDTIQNKKLYKAIEELSEIERAVLIDSVIDNNSSKEISKKLNKSESAIYMIKHKVIKKIRKHMED